MGISSIITPPQQFNSSVPPYAVLNPGAPQLPANISPIAPPLFPPSGIISDPSSPTGTNVPNPAILQPTTDIFTQTSATPQTSPTTQNATPALPDSSPDTAQATTDTTIAPQNPTQPTNTITPAASATPQATESKASSFKGKLANFKDWTQEHKGPFWGIVGAVVLGIGALLFLRKGGAGKTTEIMEEALETGANKIEEAAAEAKPKAEAAATEKTETAATTEKPATEASTEAKTEEPPKETPKDSN